MPQPLYNWEEIERDYRAGVLPIGAIATKYGCSVSTIMSTARRKGWVRNDSREVARQVTMFSAAVDARKANLIGDSPITIEELEKHAAMTIAGVVMTHRKDIATLRGMSSLLVDRLRHFLDGEEMSRPLFGARESPADLLEKLSRVTVRVVQLEREAYGLVDGSVPRDSVPNDNSDEIRQIYEALESLREVRSDVAITKK